VAVLVTARAHDQQYDWTTREIAARQDGLEPSNIGVIRDMKSPAGLGEKEATVIQFGRELFGRHYVSAETYARALRLFGERVFPVCAKAVIAKDKMRSPSDLSRHVLLHLDDPERSYPWLSWEVWLELMEAHDVRPAGALRFSHYDQLIQAALDGQGIALGRSPLVDRWLRQGKLVLPFGKRYASSPADSRAYFVILARGSEGRTEVGAFYRWLLDQVRAAPQ